MAQHMHYACYGKQNRSFTAQASLAQRETLYQKQPTQKWRGMAQVVECLTSKHKALSSNSSTENIHIYFNIFI
jgi:hypothetical protein